MTHVATTPAPRTLREQFSLENAKKAYAAGVAGAVAAASTVSIASVLSDGKVDGPELVAIGGGIVGGFLFGFLGAWLPSQPGSAPTK